MSGIVVRAQAQKELTKNAGVRGADGLVLAAGAVME